MSLGVFITAVSRAASYSLNDIRYLNIHRHKSRQSCTAKASRFPHMLCVILSFHCVGVFCAHLCFMNPKTLIVNSHTPARVSRLVTSSYCGSRVGAIGGQYAMRPQNSPAPLLPQTPTPRQEIQNRSQPPNSQAYWGTMSLSLSVSLCSCHRSSLYSVLYTVNVGCICIVKITETHISSRQNHVRTPN